MNRRILMQVTAPALLIGVLLLGTSIMSAWYIGRLQSNLANILSQNVTSLEAAQDLEIRVRQLRFHSLLSLLDPSPTRLAQIRQDHRNFEEGLEHARQAAMTAEEHGLVRTIEVGYGQYKNELTQLTAETTKAGPGADLSKLADAHPVIHVIEPCQELLRVNKEAMRKTAEESERVSNQARLAMFLLGLVGPIGGVVVGYSVARGLSRSIYQLGVRVQNMAQRLDQDVASVSITADGDIHNLDAQLQHVVGRVEEVVERLQEHQRKMLRAEQLAAVGQLGASVAHEVRNPLTGIKMLIDAALRPQNSKALTRDDLQVIRGEIDRMEQTVQGLLDFARLPEPQRTILDLRDAVSRASELIQARASQQGVEIVIQTANEPTHVYVDPGQLHTVLVNLFLNALDAMPRGGRLEVNLHETHNSAACLTIVDTGPGIPAQMVDRLFSPFASSKPTGTGLGLSISLRIIEEHGGRIEAVNRRDGGACFTVTLPAGQQPAETQHNGRGRLTS
jgi:two-component system, NtrC family, sensor histidine kinase HydH